MSLHISLVPNYLTKENHDDYRAMVHNVPVKSGEDILKQITKPGSILKETECVAVIDAYWKAIAENLKEGIGFSCEYIKIMPAAGGVFGSFDEPFDESKHWKNVNLTAGKELHKSCAGMKVEKIMVTPAEPYVSAFIDIRTESRNQTITPGFMADILGDLLKIEGEGAGVFFINTVTSVEITAPRVHVNEPRKLTIMVPELEAGTYHLEVRTHIRNGKKLSSGKLNAILLVA